MNSQFTNQYKKQLLLESNHRNIVIYMYDNSDSSKPLQILSASKVANLDIASFDDLTQADIWFTYSDKQFEIKAPLFGVEYDHNGKRYQTVDISAERLLNGLDTLIGKYIANQ